MIDINQLSTVLGTIAAILTCSSQIALWQRKEYRLDRMRAYLNSPEGSFIKHEFLWLSYLALGIGWIISFFSDNILINELGFIAICLYALHYIKRIRRQGVLRPDLTLKAATLCVVVGVLIYGYIRLTFLPEFVSLQIATLLMFLPLIVAAGTGLTNIPFGLRKQYIVKLATQKRKQLPQLKVVGITGSFGKTSTKYFLQQLLQGSDASVISTPQHCNSYYCVATHFLKDVKDTTSIYIAEMGAYRAGEIKQIADMVKPTLAVLTSIGNQHISLFGSPEKLLAAKWELAQGLSANGTLIINGDDERLTSQAKTFKGPLLTYSLQKPADVWAESVVVKEKSVALTLHIKKTSHQVEINLLSEALLSSVLAAVTAAIALDIPETVIINNLPSLKPFARTMSPHTGFNDSFIIDDSYSGGQQPAINAINHLKHVSRSDKRIIFVPIIELGVQGEAAHIAIGQALAGSHAHIYIYGHDYQADLKKGLGNYQANVTWYNDAASLAQAVTTGLSKDSTVLIEGRVPNIVRQKLGVF